MAATYISGFKTSLEIRRRKSVPRDGVLHQASTSILVVPKDFRLYEGIVRVCGIQDDKSLCRNKVLWAEIKTPRRSI